jgi:hypothetical protein
MADIDTATILSDAAKVAVRASPPATPPIMHKAANVLGNWAARTAGSGIATAALLPWRIDPQSWPQLWHELWQMQDAVWQRQSRLQDSWMQGWAAWGKEFTQARGANTMAKLVEQEFDLIAQWQQLWRDQVTDGVSLLENLEVNYAYWVHEKLRQQEAVGGTGDVV